MVPAVVCNSAMEATGNAWHNSIIETRDLGQLYGVVHMTGTVLAKATGFGLSMSMTRTNRERP